MTVGQSQFVKNGQTIRTLGGSAAIAQGALAIVGGPGVEAWPATTTDYAALASAGAIRAPSQVVAAAVPGTSRQAMARDRLGNVFLAGTNSSGNLVIDKFSPVGALLITSILDATATSVNGPQMFQMQNGAFCCVYARAAGALYFVVFDSFLNLLAGPSNIATERAATNLVYHAAIELSGGGFAVAYQTTAGTNIALAVYSNAGSTVTAPTNVQALGGSAAQEVVRMVQLSDGHLAVAYRGTMTAAGSGGTNFNVFTTAGAVVSGPTNVDAVSTAGLLELSRITGFFAIAEGNGTSLVAAVYNNAGAQQGSTYTTGDTLNNAYPQIKLTNDGVLFWLAWFSSVSNGVYVNSLSSAGAIGQGSASLGGSIIAAATFAMDAVVVNGLLAVLAASSTTGGQYLMTIGLPDASLGAYAPYVRSPPLAYGAVAATTGSNGPRLLSGGAGFYDGTSPPSGQPVRQLGCGDFTVIAAYDHQNVATTVLGVQKLEASAIVGICQASFSAGQPGVSLAINPGPGEYPTLGLAGTYGTSFNHLGAIPVGTSGSLYGLGAGLSGVSQGNTASSDRIGVVEDFAGPEANIPSGSLLCKGTVGSPTLVNIADYPALFAKIATTWGGDGVTTFALPPANGRLRAGADNMGGVDAGVLGGNPSVGGIAGVAGLGVTGGQKAHAPTIPEMAAHDHTGPTTTASAQFGSIGQIFSGASGGAPVGATGGGSPFNVTNPILMMNTIIWYR